LNQNYEGKWIGRGGLVAWPAHPPNLNPLDFFLWDCMKLRVYHSGKPEARHQLVWVINEAAVGIRNKLDVCSGMTGRMHAVQSEHFECVLRQP
jgi:hypothetical protein